MQALVTGNRVLGGAAAGDVSEVQVSNDMLVNNSVTFNSQTVALGGSGTIDVA